MFIYQDILSSVSSINKYYYHYCRLIDKSKERAPNKTKAKDLLGYIEGHHIIPKSFNLHNSDDDENIVYLTAKEHIMAHRLLCKFIVEENCLRSALRAFHCMSYVDNGGKNKRNPSIHHLAKAREAARIANSVKKGIQGVPHWFDKTDDMGVFIETLENHVSDGISDPKIGKIYGVSSTCIHAWRKQLGIQNRRWQLRDENWLKHHYLDLKMSSGQIADIIGCTGTAVQNYLKKFNIPIRDAITRQRLRGNR